MAKLTDEAKEYIQKNLHLSDRQLSRDMLSEFQIKITHKPIGNYRKKLAKSKVDVTPSKVEVPKSKPKIRKSKVEIIPTKTIRKELKDLIGIIPDPSKPKLTEEEVTEIFDFFEYLSRKRFGKKYDREKVLKNFLKLNGVKVID